MLSAKLTQWKLLSPILKGVLFFILSSFVSNNSLISQSLDGSTGGSDYKTGSISYSLSGSTGCRCYNVFFRADLRQSNSYVQTIEGDDNRDAIANSGSFSARVLGPNATATFGLRVWRSGKNYYNGFPAGCYPTNSNCGAATLYNDLLTLSTAPIKPPTGLSASQNKLGGVQLSWSKGTNIPNNAHGYKIYRKLGDEPEVLIKTIDDGQVRSYFDPIGPDQQPTYYITTYTDSWGGHESTKASVNGQTYAVDFQASRGIGSDTRLSWNALPVNDSDPESVKEIIIFRDDIEIRLESGSIRSVSDLEGIPGYPHQYGIELIQNNGTRISYAQFPVLSATGYRTPNGVIEGSIFSPGSPEERTPIPGIRVCAEAISDIRSGPYEGKRCGITQPDGSYRIDSLYYGQGATIRVTPTDSTRHFDPAFLEEELAYLGFQNPDNRSGAEEVNFTDTTSISLTGHIRQFFAGTSCAVEGVKVTATLSDGSAGFETLTDENGFYAIAVNQPGNYILTPDFSEHAFSPATHSAEYIEDTQNLDFEDVQMQTLSGKVLGGCESFLGWARLRIFEGDDANNSCFDTLIMTDATSGEYAVELPARHYTVEISEFFPSVALDPISFTSLEPQKVDLTEGDQKADFTYRLPLKVSIEFPESSYLCDTYEYPVVGQYSLVPVSIKVEEAQEEFDIACPLDTGRLVIQDEISDSTQTLPFRNGLLTYEMLPGEPNLTGDFLKSIDVVAFDITDEKQANANAKALVVGNRPREETFVTVTPEVPYLILRDPPGDRSFSYFSQTESVQRAFSIYNELGKPFKLGKVLLKETGKSILTNPLVLVSPTERIAESFRKLNTPLYDINENNWDQRESIWSISTTNKFSTSDDPGFIGADGDVYIGAALNLAYSLTDVVEFNEETCQVDTSISMIFAVDDVPTQFIYTENHIKQTIIPDLNRLKELYAQRYLRDTSNTEILDSIAFYHNQVNVWENTIAHNEGLKKKAQFSKNISIDAGSEYSDIETTDSISSFSVDFSISILPSIAFKLQLKNKISIPFIGTGPEQSTIFEAGAQLRMQMRLGQSYALRLQSREEVGYTLKDDDGGGDFMSVNVAKDPAYGTPVFKLVNGRSSCPWEPGTQPRDFAQLQADQRSQTEVSGDFAEYKLTLSNISQSDEKRTYELLLLDEFNSEGAFVTINGRDDWPLSFTIDPQSTRDATVRIYKEGNACAYPDLPFVLRPECPDEKQLADTLFLSTYFDCGCGDITLSLPEENWIVDGLSNDQLLVKMEDYNYDLLRRVILQYAPAGTANWEEGYRWEQTDLGQSPSETTLLWNLPDIPDGEYQLRLLMLCQENGEYVYSNKVQGRIDRMAPVVLGSPEPFDQMFEPGDRLAVRFNEAINCFRLEDNKIRLFTQSQSFGITYGCQANELIIIPDEDLSPYAGEEFTVEITGVEDQYANQRSIPVSWTFTVVSGQGTTDDDIDDDGIPDDQDNCPLAANANQRDLDGDGIGDVCDEDLDGDGILNEEDNCPEYSNPDQNPVCTPEADGDGDGIINREDNCPTLANEDQSDIDKDGIGDVCDDDMDGDGLANWEDNCPTFSNPDKANVCAPDFDYDGDGIVNANDNCPQISNPDQSDSNGDGIGDVCDDNITSVVELLDGKVVELMVFPNPTSGEASIEIIGEAVKFTGPLQIFNQLGQLMRSFQLPEQHVSGVVKTLDLSNLPVGMYTMRMIVEGKVVTERVVVEK